MTKQFHDLAMRTAPSHEHPFPAGESVPKTTYIAKVLFAYIHAARDLDRLKSILIYGKVKDESKYDLLPPDMSAASFDNLEECGDFVHAILGIASEGGELVEHLLWMLMGRSRLEIAPGVLEETGDVDWFQELLARALATPVDESRAAVIDKLRKRFPDKFDATAAVERADKQ